MLLVIDNSNFRNNLLDKGWGADAMLRLVGIMRKENNKIATTQFDASSGVGMAEECHIALSIIARRAIELIGIAYQHLLFPRDKILNVDILTVCLIAGRVNLTGYIAIDIGVATARELILPGSNARGSLLEEMKSLGNAWIDIGIKGGGGYVGVDHKLKLQNSYTSR